MKPNRYEVRAENDCTVLGVDGRCSTLLEARRLARKAVSSALSVAPRAGIYDYDPLAATDQDPADCREVWESGRRVWKRPPAVELYLQRIETEAGTVTLTPDGCWFQFTDDGDGDPLRPVVPPDERFYAYSHGGEQYRAAVRAIWNWKQANGWGVTD